MFSLGKDIDTEVEQIDFIEVAKECGIVSKGAAWVAFLVAICLLQGS
jgi:hypothetical protein